AEEKVVVQEKVVEKAVAVIVTPDPSTAVVFYRPDAVDEAPEGTADCWGSLTSLRALRCANGSQIHDPCFVHGGDTVVCPGEGPDLGAAPACPTAIFTASILGSDAPLPSPSIGTIPWRIELADGTTCRFVSGATTVYEGQRLNY